MAEEDHVAEANARLGSVLRDKWRLDVLLGVGGSASVYAATHKNGKRGAIKLLHPQLVAATTFVQRFLREGYVANKIAHPGVVSILDEDKNDDGTVFLVMELLEGESVERAVRTRGALPLKESLLITVELLDVLAAAHDKGIIHRDIKPANLFLTAAGKLKVLDFGIARLDEPGAVGATRNGAPLGTPAFMPPEQARGRWDEVDARSDVYAAGATLFHMLTAKRPRDAGTSNEELLLAMTDPIEPLGRAAPHLPRGVCELVDRAVAFDKEGRWPDARTMQGAAVDALREEGFRATLQTQEETATLELPRKRGSEELVVSPRALPPPRLAESDEHPGVLSARDRRVPEPSEGSPSSAPLPRTAAEGAGDTGAGALSALSHDSLGRRVALPRASRGPDVAPLETRTPMASVDPTAAPEARRRSAWPWVIGFLGLALAAGVGVRAWTLRTARVASPAPRSSASTEPSASATPSTSASAPVFVAPRPPSTGLPKRHK